MSLNAWLLATTLAGAASPPAADEAWTGLHAPEVGTGEPAVTVLVRGASEQRPLQAVLGELQAPLQPLGLALSGVTLRGAAAGSALVLQDGRGRRAWQGSVPLEDGAIVAFSWVGGPTGRPERIAAPSELPQPPASGLGGLSLAALLAGLVGGLFRARR